MGAEFLFMDDNARPHRANIVDECLQSEDITHMDWPAYSPDLNPIEHVKFFRPKTSSSSNTETENQGNGNGASNEFSRCRAESSTSKTHTNESPVVDFIKNNLSQEDELFEMQRKQLERLKSDESQSVVVLVSDHSYSSLPTSCFNVAPTPSKPLAQYHLVSAELCEESDSSNFSVPTTTSAPLLQLLDTSSITSNVSKVVLTNGPIADKVDISNDSNSLERVERHRKEILGTSIESLVNFPQNSIVNSCLPAVPSIDLGGGAASHSSDTIHVINSKTFSTPQSALRFTSLEQNGNETRRYSVTRQRPCILTLKKIKALRQV
ncbi:enhancer of polycomb-like protein [Trichonephila clavipes]|nr:enhancer of polycomb-like protein [Trichonephila clavipes]